MICMYQGRREETYYGMDSFFNEQMRKTGVNFFDYYLIHGIDKELLEIYEDGQ